MSWQLLAPAIIDGLVKLGMEYFKEDSGTKDLVAPGSEAPKPKMSVTVLATLDVEASTLDEARTKLEYVASSAGVTILEVDAN
jgi:hypothetical protein